MGYKALLDKQALKAFNLIKDLATDAIFIDSTVSGFNFDTESIEKSNSTPTTVKLVVVETKKKDRTITKQVMGRLIDIGIVDEYDTVTFEGKTWNVGVVTQELGQIVIFSIHREID